MKRIKHPSRAATGRAMRRGLVGLSAVAGLLAGAPGAAGPSATGAASGAWRHIAAAANTYEVVNNATACLRLLVDYGGAFVHQASTTLMGALGTMPPIYQVVIVVVLLSVLSLFAKQALAHVMLKGMEERLADLPGDKNVVPSPGIGAAAFVMPPAMNCVYPECRAWFPIRALSYRQRRHPSDAAKALKRVPIAAASVDELRCILRLLRASWLFVDERAMLDFLQMRTFDLRDFADCAGQNDENNSLEADDAGGARDGGGWR